MTLKEKRNTQKARVLLLEVRNFLTKKRDDEQDEKKQDEYHRIISLVMNAIMLTNSER